MKVVDMDNLSSKHGSPHQLEYHTTPCRTHFVHKGNISHETSVPNESVDITIALSHDLQCSEANKEQVLQ